MKNKITSILLAIIFISQSMLTSFALTSKTKTLPSDTNVTIQGQMYSLSADSAYYDDELDAYVVAFTMNDGNITYLTQEEADEARKPKLLEFSSNPNCDEGIMPHNAGTWYSFSKKSETQVTGKPLKASADFIASSGGTIAKSSSFTVSEQFSVGLSADAKKYIRSNISVSYGWIKSRTYTSSYTATVDPGRKAYLAFSPYYIKVEGSYITWFDAVQVYVEPGYGMSVKLTDTQDEPDGLWELVYY